MMDDNAAKTGRPPENPTENDQPSQKQLSPEAERALAEAQARRAEYERIEQEMPKERGGRGGHDPIRYGDWEKKGLAIDF